MTDKCNKYESLFIFGSEEALQEHLDVCEDCRAEHEKMERTASLVKEAKPYYKKNSNRGLIKLAAGLTILFLAYFSVSNVFFTDNTAKNSLAYTENDSVIAEMGLPTDEYGLLAVY